MDAAARRFGTGRKRGMMSRMRFALLLFVLSFALAAAPGRAAPATPDRAVAAARGALAANPGDAAAWIALAEAQRAMGYQAEARDALERAAGLINALPAGERGQLAGLYSTTKAWLEYDATNWQAAADQAKLAVKYAPGRESRLVQALAIAALPDHEVPLRQATAYLQPSNESGPDNRLRNFHWISFVRHHHESGPIKDWNNVTLLNVNHVFDAKVSSPWGELTCRRDYGYIFESNAEFALAAVAYERSAQAGDCGLEAWATRGERLSPLQRPADKPLPFWTNADGGYVTGSLMAYAGHACERMLSADSDSARAGWATRLESAATRGLAVYLKPTWPWLWRALARQALGEGPAAARDLVEAEDLLAGDEQAAALLAFARGHAALLSERHAAAGQHLESAVTAGLDAAPCWADLGLVRAFAGDRGGARDAFDKAVALAPQSALAWHNRGMLSLQEGDLGTAVADLRRAAELAPHDPQVRLDVQKAELAARGAAQGGRD